MQITNLMKKIMKKSINIEELDQKISDLTIQREIIEKRILSLVELKLLLQKEASLKELVNKPKIEVS